MKKPNFIILAGLVLMPAVRLYAYDNHDFQVWNTDTEEWKINKASKLVFEQEFRWADNASKLSYQHYDQGYVYLFNKYFNFGAGLRYIEDKKTDKFREETEPYLVVFTYWNPAGFNLSNRTRIEYRYFDYQVNSWRFRNKLDIKLPWKFTRFQLQPMISDEVFFKFNGIDLNENRLYGGFAFTLTANLRGELCYMLRSTKNTNVCTWNDVNVLSAKLKLAF
jgi:hypothetical protein